MLSYIDGSIISFYISFLGIVGMICFRILELRSGKKLWFLRLVNRVNHDVRSAYHTVKRWISYINRKSAVALIQWIAYHILSWAREAYIWAHKKAHAHPPSKRVIDMVRGRAEVNKNGGSSIYLKKISEKGEDEVR